MNITKPDTPATRKIRRIDQAMTNLFRQREQALRERGQELGFKPCGDCFEGFCTMNCSSALLVQGTEHIAASIWAGCFPEKATAEQVRQYRVSQGDLS